MITADAQQLEPGGRITLFELDASSFGADQLFFHAHLQSGVIWWQGQEYGPWPIEATGFSRTSDQPPNPRLKVSNIDGRITALCLMFDDLVGARVIRRQTLVKYLDGANFPPIVNLVNFSSNPNGAGWTNNGAVAAPVPGEVVDGITFTPTRISSNGGTSNNRRAPLRPFAVSAGQAAVATVYVRFGSSQRVRIVLSNTVGGAYRESLFNLNADGSVAAATSAAGPLELLGFEQRAGGVVRVTVRIVYNGANSAAPTLQVGPTSAVVGQDVILLGAQLELGQNATTFQVTTNDPVKDRHPTADPNEHFLDEIWFIERKVSETKETVEFELTTAIDLNGEQLPGRQVIAGVCGWLIRGGYRGPYCGYNGPAVADANDVPTTDPARDQCGGRVGSCKLRFGADKPLPYGGFPAAGLLRT
ncbi:phage minor tail protein L [Stenotrophomonas maltophilia group sp. msm1]|uniref:phage minor tail protein L n=1 Tax=Stenotrophomonas maltophilia group sp. msm1 TaxID=3061099 RepID=UPI0028954C37|nr:phage minor tail protein L [Stenotrophomonas maltophilia group sp. msm1]MDT3557967.1 phage minor tail protein L [Stenotrophomonas maltophilia group sp. msm1]